jgi:acetyl-CoA carboxylase biotin carboxyl carrier protein
LTGGRAGYSFASMNLDIIARLVQILKESPELGAIEVRRGFFGAWTAVRVSKAGQPLNSGTAHTVLAERAAAPAGAVPAPAGEPGGRREAAAPPAAVQLLEIRSPMVGTFYTAPEPGAEPYVKVGSRVAPGQMVCIIEAMKIMNEIESEVQGVIREVAVESGHPVEFGQTLFRVDPHG